MLVLSCFNLRSTLPQQQRKKGTHGDQSLRWIRVVARQPSWIWSPAKSCKIGAAQFRAHRKGPDRASFSRGAASENQNKHEKMRENSNRNPNRFRDMLEKNPDSVIEQRRRFCNRVATTRIYPYSDGDRLLWQWNSLLGKKERIFIL